MRIGFVRERVRGEHRVALIPAQAAALVKSGHEVVMEQDAGAAAGYPDQAFTEAGTQILATRQEVFATSALIVQVRTFSAARGEANDDLTLYRPGQLVIGLSEPLSEARANAELATRGVTLLSMELMPRITRAQVMDVLSSQATIAGYRAVLLAASRSPRLFPMLMTAAGTMAPARVLVIGAGVAGLQAIAVARRLGAVVTGYDVRAAVKEQVESLGARFLELDVPTAQAEGQGGYAREMDEEFYKRQQAALAAAIAGQNVVITTAAIPGRQAPRLVTAAMARGMSPGSVIVDMAAERGGNCELTRPDETVIDHGVTILGPTNLPAEAPYHASQMYSRNVQAFIEHLAAKSTAIDLDRDDEILRETLVARGGEIVHPRVREALGLPPLEPARAANEPLKGAGA